MPLEHVVFPPTQELPVLRYSDNQCQSACFGYEGPGLCSSTQHKDCRRRASLILAAQFPGL